MEDSFLCFYEREHEGVSAPHRFQCRQAANRFAFRFNHLLYLDHRDLEMVLRLILEGIDPIMVEREEPEQFVSYLRFRDCITLFYKVLNIEKVDSQGRRSLILSLRMDNIKELNHAEFSCLAEFMRERIVAYLPEVTRLVQLEATIPEQNGGTGVDLLYDEDDEDEKLPETPSPTSTASEASLRKLSESDVKQTEVPATFFHHRDSQPGSPTPQKTPEKDHTTESLPPFELVPMGW